MITALSLARRNHVVPGIQSAESAIEIGRRLQRHQIAGLRNRGSCSIPTTPTKTFENQFLYYTDLKDFWREVHLFSRESLEASIRLAARNLFRNGVLNGMGFAQLL